MNPDFSLSLHATQQQEIRTLDCKATVGRAACPHVLDCRVPAGVVLRGRLCKKVDGGWAGRGGGRVRRRRTMSGALRTKGTRVSGVSRVT